MFFHELLDVFLRNHGCFDEHVDLFEEKHVLTNFLIGLMKNNKFEEFLNLFDECLDSKVTFFVFTSLWRAVLSCHLAT